MPNKRYAAGRRFEYKRKGELEAEEWTVIRASGSHGPFDLVAIKEYAPVQLIQCKVVQSWSGAKRELKAFPPLPRSAPGAYEQVLDIWVKDLRKMVTKRVS